MMSALAGFIGTQVVLTLLTGHARAAAYSSPQFTDWGERLKILRGVTH